MSKEKDSLILYESFFEATQDLSVSDKGEIWEALHAYISNNEDYEFTSITAKLAWNFIKLQLNADAKKWQETCKRRSEAGKRGMQKRWNNSKDITSVNFVINENNKNNKAINVITEKSSVINEITKITDTDTESDTESDTDTDTDTDIKENIIIGNNNIKENTPTLDDVLKFAKDPSVALSQEEARKFYDHYTAQSWLRSNGQQIPNTATALVCALRIWKSNSGKFDVSLTSPPRPKKPTREEIAEQINSNKKLFNELFWLKEGRNRGDYDSDPKTFHKWYLKDVVLDAIESPEFSKTKTTYQKYKEQ